MPTDLRHDLDYLRRLLGLAVKMHHPLTVKTATMLADIRDYLIYLTLDGLHDPALANLLIDHFTQLQACLEKRVESTPIEAPERESARFYVGFLFALEQLLSLCHRIAELPRGAISREDFIRSWKRTAEKLGLDQP
jgi:hypothetical protein